MIESKLGQKEPIKQEVTYSVSRSLQPLKYPKYRRPKTRVQTLPDQHRSHPRMKSKSLTC